MFITIVLLLLAIIILSAFKEAISSFFQRSTLKKGAHIAELIALDQFEDAKKELLPLLQKKKGHKHLSLYYVKVLRGTGEVDKALEETIKAARCYPEELLFRLEEATLLLSLNRIEEAMHAFSICEPILREEKDLYLFALTHYKLGHYEATLHILHPLLASTQDPALLILAGNCKMHLRDFSKAIYLFNISLSLSGEHHEIYIKLAESYRRHGNLAQSEKLYRYILEKDPADAEATLGMGACMVERGFLQKALLFYQDAPAWTKGDMRLYFQAALLALKLKRYEEGQKLFEYVTDKQQMPSLESLIYHGFCLEKQQKWQEAESLYLRLISLYPDHAHGYRALSWLFGVGLSNRLSLEEGLTMAHSALSLSPDSLSWEILSACEARGNNFVRAFQILESLAHHTQDDSTKQRLSRAMRQLRKNLPLNNNFILREMVA